MSNRLEDLEPLTFDLLSKFWEAAKTAGFALRITQTLRSMDEQLKIYAQGRQTPGKIVTYAQPGESPHNFGMAFDICFAGKTLEECYPPAEDPRWLVLGQLGEDAGLAWGGRWKGKKRDLDHFERPNWKFAAHLPQSMA